VTDLRAGQPKIWGSSKE